MDDENILNNFITNLTDSIQKIEPQYKENYFLYKVNTFFNQTNNTNIKNILTNLLSKNISNHIEKIKKQNNDCDIVLITQYYEATNEQRYKENLVCLINNIVNHNINKVCLLNEKQYDLNFIFEK